MGFFDKKKVNGYEVYNDEKMSQSSSSSGGKFKSVLSQTGKGLKIMAKSGYEKSKAKLSDKSFQNGLLGMAEAYAPQSSKKKGKNKNNGFGGFNF